VLQQLDAKETELRRQAEPQYKALQAEGKPVTFMGNEYVQYLTHSSSLSHPSVMTGVLSVIVRNGKGIKSDRILGKVQAIVDLQVGPEVQRTPQKAASSGAVNWDCELQLDVLDKRQDRLMMKLFDHHVFSSSKQLGVTVYTGLASLQFNVPMELTADTTSGAICLTLKMLPPTHSRFQGHIVYDQQQQQHYPQPQPQPQAPQAHSSNRPVYNSPQQPRPSAPPPQSNVPPTAQIRPEDVKSLMDMGFPVEKSIAALKKCGDLQSALNYLIEQH
jgi:hypothetical protein